MKLNYLVVVLSATLVHTQAHSDGSQNQMLYSHTNISSAAEARAAALGLGVGVGQGGAGGAGGAANGGSASLTYVEAASPQQPSSVKIKNTPDGALSNIAPSADCMGVTTLGGSGPGFFVGGGSSWESKPCHLRETARIFHAFGKPEDAIAILCSSEYAAAAPSCKNLKAEESR